jgi:hypothetical protein
MSSTLRVGKRSYQFETPFYDFQDLPHIVLVSKVPSRLGDALCLEHN